MSASRKSRPSTPARPGGASDPGTAEEPRAAVDAATPARPKPTAKRSGGPRAGTAAAAGPRKGGTTKPGLARGDGRPSSKGTKKPVATGKGKARSVARPGASPAAGLVVGPVPILARVAGGLALSGALVRLLALAFPLAQARGRDVGAAANLFDWLVPLPFAGVVGAAGLLVLLGRLPRLGLAAIRTAGLVAVALLAETIYLLRAGARTTTDLPLGIGTSLRYSAGAGLVLLAVGYGLLVLALVVGQIAWPRTVMEDDGGLDRLRPRLAAWGAVAGTFAAIVLGMSPFHSSRAGLAPLPVPERAGWDLAGGALLCLVVGACAAIAATLQPRLAVVGAYAALAAALATQGLGYALLAARSPVIVPSAGGIGTLLAASVFAVLAVAAGRLARSPVAPRR